MSEGLTLMLGEAPALCPFAGPSWPDRPRQTGELQERRACVLSK